jgi:hypothetical protein
MISDRGRTGVARRPMSSPKRLRRSVARKRREDDLDGGLGIGAPSSVVASGRVPARVRSQNPTEAPLRTSGERAPCSSSGHDPSAQGGRWVTPTVGRPRIAPTWSARPARRGWSRPVPSTRSASGACSSCARPPRAPVLHGGRAGRVGTGLRPRPGSQRSPGRPPRRPRVVAGRSGTAFRTRGTDEAATDHGLAAEPPGRRIGLGERPLGLDELVGRGPTRSS